MFKILIVDDELFTREGIVSQIPWETLGITEIEEAYDGVNALEVASHFKPDILLTDVRMPRMDGIELSFKIREMYPSSEIVFLSGYSDKEYLKAAIKVKAVSYVEKPIDVDELQKAIEDALSLLNKKSEYDENIKNDIALQLINQDADISKLATHIENIPPGRLESTNFITILVNIVGNNKYKNKAVLIELQEIIALNGFNYISSCKEDNLIVIHLYWDHNKKHLSSKDTLQNLNFNMTEYLKETGTFFVCIGKEVSGINNIYNSYTTALDLLHKTFYYDPNSIIYYDNKSTSIYKLDESIIDNFQKALLNEDKQSCMLIVNRMTLDIKGCTNTPINYTKNIYYKLFLQLVDFAADTRINVTDNSESESPFECFSSLNLLIDIRDYIIQIIEKIFYLLGQKDLNKNPISAILNYIHNNYTDSDLSLQQISKNTFLTPAYICSIFKEQTEKTINSYITEYRIIKAKELLKDPNMKINDISAKVGYSDGNYFAKIFRKETDLTPSEYRKKFLS